MSTTPDTLPDIEERLRAALSARAEQVQPEDLTHLAPVVPLRRRWTAPLIVLASAACVLLVLVMAFRLTDSQPRSDDLAPQPEGPQVVLPSDVGRDWTAGDLSSPAKLDLDGDDILEKVLFLAEPSKKYDGRTRLQTTLSSTGEEAYGIAQLSSTIGTNALDPIDADGDGDQELVLYYDDLGEGGPGGIGYPMVFDLRDGLLVQAVAEEPGRLIRGYVQVPGSQTEFYDLVHVHDYWIEDGALFSSRTVDSFARGNMTLMRPESSVVDAFEWSLDDDGILRAGDPSCLVMAPEAQVPCGSDAEEGFVPYIDSVSSNTIGVGESAEFTDGYQFTASVEALADPSLVVEGSDGGTLNYGLEIEAPRVHVQQPSIFLDGASFVVTSASDPDVIDVLVQNGDELRALEPIGEIAFGTGTSSKGLDYRTWFTKNGALVTVTAQEDGSWTAWSWQMVSRTEMAALPWGTVCFDDVEDPTTAHSC